MWSTKREVAAWSPDIVSVIGYAQQLMGHIKQLE